MREIVLDTETTGLDPEQGHRIVEIGCIELKNHIPTGKTYHVYVNPMRDMPEVAFNIHGLSYEFLKKHPIFEEHARKFLDFIKNDRLVIHNARFDMKFINAELKWAKIPPIPFNRAIDTLSMARTKFPGSPASLDALCKRFKVDNTNRVLHGALLDSELLAKVYLELIGGAQPDLVTNNLLSKSPELNVNSNQINNNSIREQRTFTVTKEEKENHDKLLKKINNPIWEKLAKN